MAKKRVTNECIQRELGAIAVTLKSLRHDLEEVKEMAPRVRSLEVFRSYVKGVSSVCVLLASTIAAFTKNLFNHI